ncbi:MAG: hypothetical protein AAF430_17520 [Myxococcota bacterium]
MLDWQQLPERVNRDPEFQVASRHWTARLRLDTGDASRLLRFEEGRLVDIDTAGAESACDLFVSAPESDWEGLLAREPRPFYQDLFGAQIHHDVRLPEDPLAYAAYYPALRRLVQLMSALRHEEESG